MNERLIVSKDGDAFRLKGSFSGTDYHRADTATASLAKAVELTPQAGGEVFLEPGTYPLDEPVRLKSHMTLGGAAGAVLTSAPSWAGEAAVVCEGLDNARIEGVEVRGDEEGRMTAGIILEDCGDCAVRNVRCHRLKGYGVWIRNGSFLCTVEGCSVHECERANVFFEKLGRGRYGDFIPSTLANCTLYGGDTGVLCRRSVCATMVGCTVYQPRDVAFLIDRSNSVLISGCRTYLCGKNAVRIERGHENNVTGCIFGRQGAECMVISDSCWGVVSANEMIFTGAYKKTGPNREAGSQPPEEVTTVSDVLRLSDAHGYAVTGNVIFNWSTAPVMDEGIREDERSSHNVFAANNVNYFRGRGIDAPGRDSLRIGNVLRGPAPYKT